MRWGQNWRKLYRYPSSAWLALPLSVRGFGDELLRYVEDDGRIYVGTEDPVAVASRLMGAHPTERKWVAKCIEALTRDGFCSVADGYLTVRNFVEAQGAVSPSGVRMRAHRAKASDGKPTTDRPQTSDEPPSDRPQTSGRPPADLPQTSEAPAEQSPRNDSAADVTVTGIRIEETRRDQTRTEERQGQLSGVAEAPPTSKPKGRERRASKLERDPPPFPYQDALVALAPAGSSFLVPRDGDLDGGTIIAVRRRVRQFPDLALWEGVGAFIAAGGVEFPADLDAAWVASSRFCGAVTKFRRWDERGRPAIRAAAPDRSGPVALARVASAREGIQPVADRSATAEATAAGRAVARIPGLSQALATRRAAGGV